MGFAFMALFAAGVIAMTVLEDDTFVEETSPEEEMTEEEAPEEEVTEETEQPMLSLVDGTLTGSDGNDTIDLTGFPENSISRVDAGAGDDTLITGAAPEAGTSLDIFGGEGNDTLNAFAIPAADVYGGDGNDIISIADHEFDEFSYAYGGAGDDTINLDTFADTTNGGVNAAGGEGADTFNVAITHGYADFDNDSAPPDPDTASFNVATIEDFDATEDALVINLLTDNDAIESLVGPATDHTYSGIRIEENSPTEQAVIVSMTDADGNIGEFTITLLGDGPFPSAENIFVNA